jgi:predicted metal-dependent hydrolase
LFKREVWEQLKEYERPGFHPNDRDDTELIERWRVELFGEEGTLNQYVLKAAV